VKKIIVRIEKIGFPNLSIEELDAKVDTGAYTSSLNCQNIKIVKKENAEFVQFSLFDPEHPSYSNTLFESKLEKIRSVKSSNGLVQER